MNRAGATPLAGAARRLLISLLGAAMLSGCGPMTPLPPPAGGAPDLLLMGEQHDQPDHQRQIAAEVRQLIAQRRLSALVLEMVEDGRDTRDVFRFSTESSVRSALDWDERGWPWASYGPVVMAAVRAGVPVLGGNLPRDRMRESMADASIDRQLPEAVRARILKAVDEGHCGLLKPEQLPAMVRVQIARDRRMAEVMLRARHQASAGQVVVLQAGEQHVARDRGVPLHLDLLGLPGGQMRAVGFGEGGTDALPVDERRPARRVASEDHCALFRAHLQRPAPAASQPS